MITGCHWINLSKIVPLLISEQNLERESFIEFTTIVYSLPGHVFYYVNSSVLVEASLVNKWWSYEKDTNSIKNTIIYCYFYYVTILKIKSFSSKNNNPIVLLFISESFSITIFKNKFLFETCAQ